MGFELEEIFDNDLNYDNYGNVDYTVILKSDIFVTLERQRVRRQNKKQDAFSLDVSHQRNQDMEKLTDNRKVVVEDLIYIDDLEILIYTTISPQTSTIFVTNAKKTVVDTDENQVEIINLQSLQKKLGDVSALDTTLN